MSEEQPGNAPEWTVSELAGALKRTIESEFGFVRLRAEISGYRGPHGSGHAYFSLKDEGARIDAVIWRTTFARLKVKPAEGLEVIVTGRITTFPGKSSYQIIIDSLQPAGVGALMALIEERRKKLAGEGLFDALRKRPLPRLPRIIGVVTSPTGAVIRDILHRIADRFPSHVLVWPVRVQGETSAAEVAAAIAGFNAFGSIRGLPRPDVLIVARGGGSLEDLWSFNEEIVVRAAAASQIPLIAAVGHETDWTLIDHAADVRAPTPTGAAEMAVPVRSELLAQLDDLARRHAHAMDRGLERRRAEFRAAARALPGRDALLAVPSQRLDAASARLANALRAGLDARRIRLGRVAGRLAAQSPQAKLARAAARLESLADRLLRAMAVARDRQSQRSESASARLATAMRGRLRLARQAHEAGTHRLTTLDERRQQAFRSALVRHRTRLEAVEQMLNSLGYRSVLARGFALVRDADGAPVRNAGAIAAGAKFDVEFADGHAVVVGGDGSSATSQRSRSSKPGRRSEFSQLDLLL
jgi:exodeoxyribonuclease VII large subunit